MHMKEVGCFCVAIRTSILILVIILKQNVSAPVLSGRLQFTFVELAEMNGILNRAFHLIRAGRLFFFSFLHA